MAEEIKFVVVGHHTRLGHAQRLAALLHAHLLVDDDNHGANWNHRRALEWAAEQTCRVVVLEDDAIPVHGFINKISDWLARFPDSLISFYLGTSRPPQWQPTVAAKLSSCRETLTLPTLIHGVCYSIPQNVWRVFWRAGRIISQPILLSAEPGGGRWFICPNLWLSMQTGQVLNAIRMVSPELRPGVRGH